MTGFITWPQPREEALGPDLEWSYVRVEMSFNLIGDEYNPVELFGDHTSGLFQTDLKIKGVICADDGSIIPESFYLGYATLDQWKRLEGPPLWSVEEWFQKNKEETQAYQDWALENNKPRIRVPIGIFAEELRRAMEGAR